MKSGYTHQAKATKRFGIEFRSKLEAQWAYHFEEQGLDWDYADSPWFDFTVESRKVEVKPASPNFFFDVILRVPFEQECVICLGELPGSCFWFVSEDVEGGVAQGYLELCGVVTFLRDDNWRSRPDGSPVKIEGFHGCQHCKNATLLSVDATFEVMNWCRNCRCLNTSVKLGLEYRKQNFANTLETLETLIHAAKQSWDDAWGCFDTACDAFATARATCFESPQLQGLIQRPVNFQR